MLMYGKEVETKTKDRPPVPHYSEPKSKKSHHGNMHNRPFCHGYLCSQRIEKQSAAFPNPANRVTHDSVR